MKFSWTWAVAALLMLAAACQNSITPHVSAVFDAHRSVGGVVSISVEVRNDSAERATVPLLVVVQAFEMGTPTATVGIPVIRPAAFVLNKLESRKLTYQMDTKASVITLLTVKEAERGILLQSKTRTVDSLGAPTTGTAPAQPDKSGG